MASAANSTDDNIGADSIVRDGTQSNKAAGIGVQFSAQDNGTTRNKIEGFLAGALQADRPTHTM